MAHEHGWWAARSRPGKQAGMTRQERVTRVLVELADTLVAGFDVIDFLHTLVERSVELLAADAAGLMLADQQGHLEVVAASSEEARVLELFELQSSQGPCMDCFTSGRTVGEHRSRPAGRPLAAVRAGGVGRRISVRARAAAAAARSGHRRDEPVLRRRNASERRGCRPRSGNGGHRDHQPAPATPRARARHSHRTAADGAEHQDRHRAGQGCAVRAGRHSVWAPHFR